MFRRKSPLVALIAAVTGLSLLTNTLADEPRFVVSGATATIQGKKYVIDIPKGESLNLPAGTRLWPAAPVVISDGVVRDGQVINSYEASPNQTTLSQPVVEVITGEYSSTGEPIFPIERPIVEKTNTNNTNQTTTRNAETNPPAEQSAGTATQSSFDQTTSPEADGYAINPLNVVNAVDEEWIPDSWLSNLIINTANELEIPGNTEESNEPETESSDDQVPYIVSMDPEDTDEDREVTTDETELVADEAERTTELVAEQAGEDPALESIDLFAASIEPPHMETLEDTFEISSDNATLESIFGPALDSLVETETVPQAQNESLMEFEPIEVAPTATQPMDTLDDLVLSEQSEHDPTVDLAGPQEIVNEEPLEFVEQPTIAVDIVDTELDDQPEAASDFNHGHETAKVAVAPEMIPVQVIHRKSNSDLGWLLPTVFFSALGLTWAERMRRARAKARFERAMEHGRRIQRPTADDRARAEMAETDQLPTDHEELDSNDATFAEAGTADPADWESVSSLPPLPEFSPPPELAADRIAPVEQQSEKDEPIAIDSPVYAASSVYSTDVPKVKDIDNVTPVYTSTEMASEQPEVPSAAPSAPAARMPLPAAELPQLPAAPAAPVERQAVQQQQQHQQLPPANQPPVTKLPVVLPTPGTQPQPAATSTNASRPNNLTQPMIDEDAKDEREQAAPVVVESIPSEVIDAPEPTTSEPTTMIVVSTEPDVKSEQKEPAAQFAAEIDFAEGDMADDMIQAVGAMATPLKIEAPEPTTAASLDTAESTEETNTTSAVANATDTDEPNDEHDVELEQLTEMLEDANSMRAEWSGFEQRSAEFRERWTDLYREIND